MLEQRTDLLERIQRRQTLLLVVLDQFHDQWQEVVQIADSDVALNADEPLKTITKKQTNLRRTQQPCGLPLAPP